MMKQNSLSAESLSFYAGLLSQNSLGVDIVPALMLARPLLMAAGERLGVLRAGHHLASWSRRYV